MSLRASKLDSLGDKIRKVARLLDDVQAEFADCQRELGAAASAPAGARSAVSSASFTRKAAAAVTPTTAAYADGGSSTVSSYTAGGGIKPVPKYTDQTSSVSSLRQHSSSHRSGAPPSSNPYGDALSFVSSVSYHGHSRVDEGSDDDSS